MGNSHHPKSTFKGIMKGENNRILRNCSKEDDYHKTIDFLKNKFIDRKLPPQLVNEPPIPFEERSDLLHQSKSKNKDENHVTFVCPFDKQVNIAEVLEDNWNLLSTEGTTRTRLIKNK